MSSVFRVLALVGCVLAGSAFAQRVVVLEIDGDTSHKLRAQIEAAVKRAGVVEVLSLQSYKDAAARKKLRGAAAFTSAGVARTARALRFDAAVSGEVAGATYHVMIWDRTGQQLWTKDLPVKKGLLSDEFAGKLARAIAAAAGQGAAKADPNAGNEGGDDSGEGGLDLTESATSNPNANRPPEDPNRDTDLDTVGPKKVTVPGPALFTGRIMGTTTWRSQCLRAGVSACKDFATTMPQPKGIVIDFTASVPYLGFAADLEVFPLARFTSEPFHRFINGLGVVGNFGFGRSKITVVDGTSQGTGMPTVVSSSDVSWNFALAWRPHFFMGFENDKKVQPAGFVGLRVGLQGREFTIDADIPTSIPSSQRMGPGLGFLFVGADVSLPIASFFRIDLSGNLYIAPHPAAEQVIGYGNLMDPTGGVTSSGLGFEAGFSGQIYGPLGWIVHARYMSFVDKFYGQGQKWTVCNETQCGGVGEETYTQIVWGVTGSF